MAGINHSIVSRFIVSAGRAFEKKEKQQRARREIKRHFSRVKKLAEEAGRPELRSALDALEDKLEKLIELDEEILTKEKKQEASFSSLKKKLNELDEKIDSYYDIQKSRETRIEALEKRNKSELARNKREIELLEKKISDLEAMYAKALLSGKHDHSKLEEIGKRLDEFKKRLKELKE